MAATTAAMPSKAPMTREEKKVIFASSLGTVFEWYDFYLYGSLAVFIGKHFFAALDPTAQFIASLLAFAAGFIVRPFGALVFGRLGDMIGRKYTFLVTILIMGLSTFIVGILPTYASIGIAAPIILILLRILQGLALGGEYGGAATYVAEHAPQGKRGAYTSWIQTTATMGLFMSLLVILGTRTLMGEEAFAAWGWRIPFIVSILLLAISVWIRLSMNESPAFRKMKEEGKTSKAPLTESFGQWKNLKIVLLALFGLVMGQGVVGYSGQFYALFFLTSSLKVDPATANIMIAASLLIGTPFFVVFGTLSDKIGRKPIILAGMALAVLTYFPLFKALTNTANPELAAAQARSEIVVRADPATCSFQGSPIAREVDFTSACDIAKRALTQRSASYVNEALPAGSPTVVMIGQTPITPPTATTIAGGHKFSEESTKAIADFKKSLGDTLNEAGYPAKAKPIEFMGGQWWTIVGILTILVIYVTMVYGPIAAMLVELFPTRIRYTSMSLPYHIGNGWFGGLLPSITFAMVAANGNMYHGLWYPIVIASVCFVIGLLFIRETKDRDIYAAD
ncbi:MHS family MFS transporter [Rubrivivax benzoatilyticus]|uniref:MHS family MFS transporter n=1 Tax=Rubrivivax benzoatilyticus TaxID=316997 RepID=A0ABX0HRS4_9BURK|nr:MFS transporter [Rubrivivax benzoatilyticus]EGJ09568.1 major facilitator superfamily transporter [Rubrivivax benzoatilyticus JA2 = ATCC BAA-35]NHK97745.1 MHS family MFS transporter [Rubrivivax benzoatilyticus]NHL23247.1 MHS family MFS transporter [Rubrivivax benzoatilyticus]